MKILSIIHIANNNINSNFLMALALKKYIKNCTISIPKKERTRKNSIITINHIKSVSVDTASLYDNNISHNYEKPQKRMQSFPVSLPKIQDQIARQEKKALSQIYTKKQRSRYELLPMKKLEPIGLMRRSSSSSSGVSYLSMSCCRRKPTDKLFSQIENIRIVEKLLLVQPSKENSKSEHQIFYKQQNKYRKNIQLTKSISYKGKRTVRHDRPWLE